MARRPRLTYAGALHHVMSRGNRRSKIFTNDYDRLDFLELLSAARERFGVYWRSYTLQHTHYHLEVKTPQPNISRVMAWVNGQYTQRWNRRHRTTGHVFEGRFKSPLIEDGHYAQAVLRYIALNPVEANYVKHPAEWPWSSHRALAGLVEPPEFLDLDWMTLAFDGPTLADCQRQYQQFIQHEERHLLDFGDTFVVGSEAFKSNVREFIGATMHDVIVPRAYRALARPPLGRLFAGIREDLEMRNRMVIRAQGFNGYKQPEVARCLGIHPNTVSKITRALKHQKYYLVRTR